MNNDTVSYGGAGDEAAADTPDTAMSSSPATSPERSNMNPRDLGEVSFPNLESNNNPDEATTTDNEQIILETLTEDDDDGEEEGEEPLLMMNMKIDEDDDVDEKEADLEEGGSMQKSSPMLKKRLADAANNKTQQIIKVATTMTQTVSPPKPLPLYPGTQTTDTAGSTTSTKKNSPEKLFSSSNKTITIDLEGQQIPNIQRPTSPETSSLAGSLARIYDLSPAVSDRSESPPRRPYRSLSRDNLHAYYTANNGVAGTGTTASAGTTAASANAKRLMMNREDENQMTFPGATRAGNGMSTFYVESNSGSNGTLPMMPRPPPTVDREKLEDIFKPLSPLQQAPHSPISTAGSVGKRLSHGARLSRSERHSTRHHGLSPLRRSRQTSNLANDFISFTVEDDDAKSVGGNTHPHAASFESFRNLYPQEHIPRLVKRNLPHFQSKNILSIINTDRYFHKGKVVRLINQDWFHVALRWKTLTSLTIFLSVWTFFILCWALIYQAIDAKSPQVSCGLGPPNEPIQFGPAFAFSLETCTTVGYGLPNGVNAFFENECPGLQVAIYFQMVWSMMFNAFLFAFFFARLARTDSRGSQVLFSNKAILEKRKDGKWFFHARIYDLDSSQPLVEAHVSMYVASWVDYDQQKDSRKQPHLLHAMRIIQPNDELGGSFYTSVPSTATHCIDAYSPLAPKSARRKVNKVDSHGLVLRDVDCLTESRSGVICPVCGESFGTHDSLKKHVRYNATLEKDSNLPIKGSHRDPNLIKSHMFKPFNLSEEDLLENLKDKEIIVVVEAIEPMVSGTFQAVQSYTAEDINIGGWFAPCMFYSPGVSSVQVDIDKFHEINMSEKDLQKSLKKKMK